MNLVTEVYKATSNFPDKERYGLVSQINRAAVSIPSNIAEGAGRNSDKEFVQFLAIANGSSFELETQLVLSQNLGYLSETMLNIFIKEIDELQKMNYALQNRLRNILHHK